MSPLQHFYHYQFGKRTNFLPSSYQFILFYLSIREKKTYKITKMNFEIHISGTRSFYPVSIYLCKVNNRNIRIRCQVYSKLTIIDTRTISLTYINFEHILVLFLVFLLLTLSMYLFTGYTKAL